MSLLKKGLVAMNAKRVTEFKNKLQSIREVLVGGVKKTLNLTKKEINQNVPDISDEAVRDSENQIQLNLDQQDWEKLKLVEQALQRIKSTDFGSCQQCKSKIPDDRLKIIPFAKYCVKCLETIESDTPLIRQNPLF